MNDQKKAGENFIADDPDQFVVEEVDRSVPYLGDIKSVYELFFEFGRKIITAYDKFLGATDELANVKAEINGIIDEYGDIFGGKSEAYRLAPWQSPERMRGKLGAWIGSNNVGDDPARGYFKWLSVNCINAARDLAKGADEDEVGDQLRDVLKDGAERWVGVRR